MMQAIRRFFKFVLLVVLFAFFLIISLPARHAYGLIQNQTPFFKPSDINGTLWSALATDVAISDVSFSRAEFKLAFLPLLSGTVSASVNFTDKNKQIAATLTRTSATSFHVSNANANFLAPELNRWIHPYKPINGNMQVVLQNLQVSGPPWRIASLQGSLVWSQALIYEVVPIELGTVRAEFKSTHKGKIPEITATLSNSESPHKIQGDVTLSSAGQYQINVFLTPSADIDPRLLLLLQSQGRAGNRGQINYRIKGNL